MTNKRDTPPSSTTTATIEPTDARSLRVYYLKRLVRLLNKIRFLSICHDSAKRFYSRFDLGLSYPVVILPLIAASPMILQEAKDCNSTLNYAVAGINICTAAIALFRQQFKLGDNALKHEQMSDFSSDLETHLQTFLNRRNTIEEMISMEDSVKGKLNIMLRFVDAIPEHLMRQAEASLEKAAEKQRRLARHLRNLRSPLDDPRIIEARNEVVVQIEEAKSMQTMKMST